MTKAIARVSAAASGDEATPPPSIAKVQILWSENGAVPKRAFEPSCLRMGILIR